MEESDCRLETELTWFARCVGDRGRWAVDRDIGEATKIVSAKQERCRRARVSTRRTARIHVHELAIAQEVCPIVARGHLEVERAACLLRRRIRVPILLSQGDSAENFLSLRLRSSACWVCDGSDTLLELRFDLAVVRKSVCASAKPSRRIRVGPRISSTIDRCPIHVLSTVTMLMASNPQSKTCRQVSQTHRRTRRRTSLRRSSNKKRC